MEVLVCELRWLWSSTLTAFCSSRMTDPAGGLASGFWEGRVQPTRCWHGYFPALSRKDWWRIGWSPHFICDPRCKDCICVSWLFCFVCFVWWSRTQLSVRLAALGKWPVQPSSHSLKSWAQSSPPGFLSSHDQLPPCPGHFLLDLSVLEGRDESPAAALQAWEIFALVFSFVCDCRFCTSVCGRRVAAQDRI